MIYTGENKATLCKGDFHPAALYKGDKKIAGYTMAEFDGVGGMTGDHTGAPLLENCYNDKVYDAQVEGVNDAVITARGKNYFDLDKVPFSNSTTRPYNNGLRAQKVSGANRGNRIPISLPVEKTIYITMDVVDSQIVGTAKYIKVGFFDSGDTLIKVIEVSSTIAHKSYAVALSEEVSYIQFYFQANNTSNAIDDYITMDNIMIRTEGDDTYEPYVEPQTIPFENGKLTADIPTFKGTTVIEIESDKEATISGKYKRTEG